MEDLNRRPTREDIWVDNKHMKRWSASFDIREMQITTRYLYMPIKMTQIQNTDNTKY